MAIKDTSRKPYIQDNDTNVKVGIDLPIHRGLRKLLFEQITNDSLIDIQDAILDKLEFWLPFVEVRDIQVLNRENTTDIGVNEIRIKILFNIKQDPNTLDSVTLGFDGNISEPESSTASGVGGGY